MKKNILISILIIIICFLSYNLYVLYEDKVDLEDSNTNLSRNVTTYREKYNNEYKKNMELSTQINFMDKHVAICPADGSGLYHKYSCDKLDTSSFYIYNIEQAPTRGFSPCKYCQDLDNTQDKTTEVVYVTDTGSKYHRSWCSYLKSKNPITKEKAISQGYSACSRCNP